MGVAPKTGTKMEPWQVETWTKTCVSLLLNFEPHPNSSQKEVGLEHLVAPVFEHHVQTHVFAFYHPDSHRNRVEHHRPPLNQWHQTDTPSIDPTGGPLQTDCYWVGSLDFNFLGNQGVSTKPTKSQAKAPRKLQATSRCFITSHCCSESMCVRTTEGGNRA